LRAELYYRVRLQKIATSCQTQRRSGLQALNGSFRGVFKPGSGAITRSGLRGASAGVTRSSGWSSRRMPGSQSAAPAGEQKAPGWYGSRRWWPPKAASTSRSLSFRHNRIAFSANIVCGQTGWGALQRTVCQDMSWSGV
jgi:hypothetical protein